MPDPRPEWLVHQLEEDAFLRQELTVTEADYRDAVLSLLTIASGDTSGGRAAAQVLLSLYSGHAFHMDLTDLCVLDLRYLQQALIAIRGRALLMREPHELIENGDQRFTALSEQWRHLSTERRYTGA